jgi:cell division cycle protein 20 (cofactor of APC complex)
MDIVTAHGFSCHQLSLWKTKPELKLIDSIPGHTNRVLKMALSPDGTTLASVAGDEYLKLWNCFPFIPSTSTTSHLALYSIR